MRGGKIEGRVPGPAHLCGSGERNFNRIYHLLEDEEMRYAMTHFFENCWKICCLSVFLMCAVFTVDTLPAEEIIFVSDPGRDQGIWISRVGGSNVRKLFNPPILVQEISIQEGDRYILCVGEGIEDIETGFDAYLFDTTKLSQGRKDLTLGRFSFVSDAAISFKGDVVFANTIFNEFPDGIYLIPKHEVHEPIPKAEKLFDGAAGYVDWAPDGKDVVFSNKEGIFLLDITTKQVSQILEYGYRPVFSPDGKKLAFIVDTPGGNGRKGYSQIGVVPLHAPQDVKIFERTETHLSLNYLTWTPDGTSIAYVLADFTFGAPEGVGWFGIVRKYSNFAVSVKDGKPRPMFKGIEGGVRVWEWTRDSFPLTPIAKFTTTWGELKRETENGGHHE